MLVLTRKEGEAVTLEVAGVTVEVCVSRIEPGRVRLAFRAPPSVPIYRNELLTQATRKDVQDGD